MNRTRITRVSAVVLSLGWMGVIFGLSSMSGSSVPGKFSTAAHFVVYAILGALYLWALPRSERAWPSAAAAVALASLYGITDEFHQSFVPGRMPDPADWLVDTAGALTAVLLLAGARRVLAVRAAARANTPDQ